MKNLSFSCSCLQEGTEIGHLDLVVWSSKSVSSLGMLGFWGGGVFCMHSSPPLLFKFLRHLLLSQNHLIPERS